MFRASSSSSIDTIPSHVRFRDVKAHKDFSENFSRRGIHSKCQVILLDFFDIDLPTISHGRGWEFLCNIPVTCLSMIMQEIFSNMYRFDYSVPHFITHVQGTCIVVTPNLIFEVLHISRLPHLDYSGCPRLRTVFKNEFSSLSCETPSSWGERQNTPCSGFAKGSRFLNMVHLFYIPCLTIIRLLSLMLDFCYPSWRGLP